MYQLTQHDSILRLSDGASIPADPANSDYAAYQAWIAAGNKPLPYEPPAKSPAEQITALQAAVQARLDAFAQERYYDSILSACTYATSKVPRFQTDGQTCVDARDTTWAKCYQVLGEVQTGKRPMPTEKELPALLPTLRWLA